ncbi:MAG: hypothetical protein ACK4UN_19530, partial [Limisphaerales bacterium]
HPLWISPPELALSQKLIVVGIASANLIIMKLVTAFFHWAVPNVCFILFVAAECLLIYGIFKFFKVI